MNEVFTKKFWQGVKKTYDEALQGPPPEAAPLAGEAPQDAETTEAPALEPEQS